MHSNVPELDLWVSSFPVYLYPKSDRINGARLITHRMQELDVTWEISTLPPINTGGMWLVHARSRCSPSKAGHSFQGLLILVVPASGLLKIESNTIIHARQCQHQSRLSLLDFLLM